MGHSSKHIGLNCPKWRFADGQSRIAECLRSGGEIPKFHGCGTATWRLVVGDRQGGGADGGTARRAPLSTVNVFYRLGPLCLYRIRRQATSGDRSVELRRLGTSGLRVSALSLGAMTFGASQTLMKGVTSSDEEVRRVFDRALEAGINLVDTANVSTEGHSEELTGEWVAGKRDQLLIATKCRFPIG